MTDAPPLDLLILPNQRREVDFRAHADPTTPEDDVVVTLLPTGLWTWFVSQFSGMYLEPVIGWARCPDVCDGPAYHAVVPDGVCHSDVLLYPDRLMAETAMKRWYDRQPLVSREGPPES